MPVNTSIIAEWLKNKATGNIWRVEGYIPITSKLTMPTTRDQLIEAFHALDEVLLLSSNNNEAEIANINDLNSFVFKDIDTPTALYMKDEKRNRVVRIFCYNNELSKYFEQYLVKA